MAKKELPALLRLVDLVHDFGGRTENDDDDANYREPHKKTSKRVTVTPNLLKSGVHRCRWRRYMAMDVLNLRPSCHVKDGDTLLDYFVVQQPSQPQTR